MVGTNAKVAVIGAGMAGLTCARDLVRRGIDVVVFDKGRGLGGRMATRRTQDGFQFDHGVQYVSSKGRALAAMLEQAENAKAVARWPKDREGPAFVGVPGMTGLAKFLAGGLDIRRRVQIERVLKSRGRWRLEWAEGHAEFDRVVVTTPAPQTSALLPRSHSFGDVLKTVTMDPCLTLMVGFAKKVPLPFEAHHAPSDNISWIVCDSAKPGRPDTTCILAQAGRDWSVRYLERDKDEFAKLMLPLVADAIGADLMVDPAYLSGHRWRYAFVSRSLGQPYLSDKEETLFAGGDWCLGAKVEHAWTSGQAIAAKIANGL